MIRAEIMDLYGERKPIMLQPGDVLLVYRYTDAPQRYVLIGESGNRLIVHPEKAPGIVTQCNRLVKRAWRDGVEL